LDGSDHGPGGGSPQRGADAGGNKTAEAGSVVSFDGSGSRDPDGAIIAYAGDFGDGRDADPDQGFRDSVTREGDPSSKKLAFKLFSLSLI
jgi:hypothetical protein